MIRELKDVENGGIECDVAVVGSGLAGVQVAREVAKCGLSVVVLESGGRDFDAQIEALNEIRSVGKPHRIYRPGSDFHTYLPRHYRGRNRLRQFGGTSNMWTGKWRAFTPGDLRADPWIPHSEWPIGIEELLPGYRTVLDEVGIEDVVAKAASSEFREADAEFDRAGLKLAVHFWQNETTCVPDHFGQELESSKRIDVILHATVTELVLDENCARVVMVECRTLDGRSLSVRAGTTILATGGLEVPRLLLASNRQIRAGIGNAHDLVGRFYMDHAKNHSGRLVPGPLMSRYSNRFQTRPRPRFSLSITLAERTRARLGLLHHLVQLTPRYESFAQRVFRMGRSRSACLDENGRVDHYRVKFATEQSPNRDSRVTLGSRRDALGMPELVADWQFTDLDHHSIEAACRELRRVFEEAGLGDLIFPADPMTLDETMDCAHPTGTTRMSNSPETGVVDRNCRVFGTQNLYVASAAVFSTSAVYSPTLTIMALASRLGAHVAEQHQR